MGVFLQFSNHYDCCCLMSWCPGLLAVVIASLACAGSHSLRLLHSQGINLLLLLCWSSHSCRPLVFCNSSLMSLCPGVLAYLWSDVCVSILFFKCWLAVWLGCKITVWCPSILPAYMSWLCNYCFTCLISEVCTCLCECAWACWTFFVAMSCKMVSNSA